MTSPASTQLTLALSGDAPPSAPPKPKRTPKPHHRPRADGPLLPIATPRFLPVIGVPKTRAECPDTSKAHCPHLRCRFNLALQDAEHRAGRPGLGNAPRDSRGWVVSHDGDLGGQSAGTTVAPRWLELERWCTAWIERDEFGQMVGIHAVNEKHWELFYGSMQAGEPIEVKDGAEVIARGHVDEHENVRLKQTPPDSAFMVKLVRVRPVESCALDAIKRYGKMSNQAIGHCLGRHRTLVARIVRAAGERAIEVGAEMGIEPVDLMRALMSMGEK